jgi:hypothetical protein
MICYNKHHYPHLPLPESVTNWRVCHPIGTGLSFPRFNQNVLYTSFVTSPCLLESFSSTQTKQKLDKGQKKKKFI